MKRKKRITSKSLTAQCPPMLYQKTKFIRKGVIQTKSKSNKIEGVKNWVKPISSKRNKKYFSDIVLFKYLLVKGTLVWSKPSGNPAYSIHPLSTLPTLCIRSKTFRDQKNTRYRSPKRMKKIQINVELQILDKYTPCQKVWDQSIHLD